MCASNSYCHGPLVHGGKLKIKLCQRKLVFDSQSISTGSFLHTSRIFCQGGRKLAVGFHSKTEDTSACDVYIYYYVLKTAVCPPSKVTRNATQSESSRFFPSTSSSVLFNGTLLSGKLSLRGKGGTEGDSRNDKPLLYVPSNCRISLLSFVHSTYSSVSSRHAISRRYCCFFFLHKRQSSLSKHETRRNACVALMNMNVGIN